MIKSSEEFKKLRLSDDLDEQFRASNEFAEIEVWLNVISKYPDLKEWVVHNKSIQIEILEILAKDSDPKVRSCVARKRKINDKIFEILRTDRDETVRYALICNTKLPINLKKEIFVEDSEWLQNQLNEKMNK
jgi:hypothetical protein